MARRFESTYRVKTRDNIGASAYWNARLEDIDIRFHALETNYGDLAKIGENITSLGLERLDNGLTPIILEALARLRSVNDVFAATSATELTIGTGSKTLVIEASVRDTFVPGAYVNANEVGNPNKFLYGNVLSYDGETGELELNVTLTMGVGTVDEWIVLSTGPRGPQGEIGVAEGAASEVGVDPIAGLTADNAQDAFEELTGIAAAITLALAGKANTSHSHSTADVTGLSGALAAKADASALSSLSASVTASLAGKAPVASPTFTGTLTVDGNVKLATGATTDVISGNTNNFSPTDLNSATVLVVAPSGAFNLTGITAPSTGASSIKSLVNDGAGVLTLTHADTGSSVGNRFSTPGGKPFKLLPNQVVQLLYLGSKWLVASSGSASGGDWVELTALSDVSITTDTTVNDDPDLQFPVLANTKYAWQADLVFTHGQQPTKLGFSWPASPTLAAWAGNWADMNTSGTLAGIGHNVSDGTGAAGTGGANTYAVRISGLIHNGANAGDVKLRWAQNASSASPNVRRAGSSLRWKEIA
jgi:hypothetical protein